MKVLYFPLKLTAAVLKVTALWMNGLNAIEWEYPPRGAERESANRAVWRGLPFVIAGEADVLNRYFDGLDADTVEILLDCAYFWLLTGSGGYVHKHLASDRPIALDWNSPSQHIILSALEKLHKFPRLKGLSRSTSLVRERISQLAEDETGPGCSVLILGPSGSGKEEVAQSLVAASSRNDREMQAISGAWLNMEPGMAMTELVGLWRGRKEERIPGLLAQHSDSVMFIDDFESAASCVQETLLRVMSVPEGSPASYRPVGGDRDLMTNVWPIFATNKDVESFARPDFLFRFGARIIWLLPLVERPADFPAIAQAIWKAIWDKKEHERDKREEPLRSDAIKHLFGKELNWDGNVRALAALLKLVAADMRNPLMNGWSQVKIIDEITVRGPRYLDWVGTYGRRSTEVPAPNGLRDTSVVLVPASPIVRRSGVSDEIGLKKKLEQVLRPRGIELLAELEKILANRVKDGKLSNYPGRHLFYAALLFLALKDSHEAGSTDLKGSLGISKAHVYNLCSAMAELFKGPLVELCECEGGAKTRFHFRMPSSIVF